jgi:hypothetical protein
MLGIIRHYREIGFISVTSCNKKKEAFMSIGFMNTTQTTLLSSDQCTSYLATTCPDVTQASDVDFMVNSAAECFDHYIDEECVRQYSGQNMLYCKATKMRKAARKIDVVAQYVTDTLHERKTHEQYVTDTLHERKTHEQLHQKRMIPIPEKSLFFVIGERVIAPFVGGIGRTFSWVSTSVKDLF